MEEEEELIEFMSGDYDKEEVEEEEGEFMSWDYDKLRRPAPSGRPAQPFTPPSTRAPACILLLAAKPKLPTTMCPRVA